MPFSLSWEWMIETLRMMHLSTYSDLEKFKDRGAPLEHKDFDVQDAVARAMTHLHAAVEGFKQASDLIDRIRREQRKTDEALGAHRSSKEGGGE